MSPPGRAGDTDERLHNVAAWREAPFYTDAERAALALAKAATQLQHGAQGVTDEISSSTGSTAPSQEPAGGTWG